MNTLDTIKAWKDPEARETMAAQGIDMPRHPAGIIKLPDHMLSQEVAGTETMVTFGCCNGYTNGGTNLCCGTDQTCATAGGTGSWCSALLASC